MKAEAKEKQFSWSNQFTSYSTNAAAFLFCLSICALLFFLWSLWALPPITHLNPDTHQASYKRTNYTASPCWIVQSTSYVLVLCSSSKLDHCFTLSSRPASLGKALTGLNQLKLQLPPSGQTCSASLLDSSPEPLLLHSSAWFHLFNNSVLTWNHVNFTCSVSSLGSYQSSAMVLFCELSK